MPISSRASGALAAVGAFSLWGLLPLYWVQLQHVPPLQTTMHRILWGAVVAWLITLAARQPRSSLSRRAIGWMVLNGVLVTTNWLVYIWAVSTGRTLDASLGYYINPLVSVLLGMVFLQERLSVLQWVAVACAVAGVLVMTIAAGIFPWVSLTLAGTFGFYGLIKKQYTISSIHSLAIELSALSLVVAPLIVRWEVTGSGALSAGSPIDAFLLLFGGVVTVAPLFLFGIAARRIRLADVGFLQYIAPTLMFVIARAVFGEPLAPGRMAGFALVWVGLVLYTASRFERQRPLVASPGGGAPR